MPMPIEEHLNINNLNVLSDFYYKFIQAHPNTTFSDYLVYYRKNVRTSMPYKQHFIFCEGLDTQNLNAFGYYTCTGTQYKCEFYFQYVENDQLYDYTSQNFDFTTNLNNCTQTTGESIYPTYQTYYASNIWQDNYLPYETYKTIEIEPSPSPEPEEPSGDTTGDTTILILISAILMLLVMYKYIKGLFDK